MDPLRAFNGDIHTREAVKAYLISFIGEEGVRMMFDRKDVSHVADAKDLIEKAFEELESNYGLSEQTHADTNPAR